MTYEQHMANMSIVADDWKSEEQKKKEETEKLLLARGQMIALVIFIPLFIAVMYLIIKAGKRGLPLLGWGLLAWFGSGMLSGGIGGIYTVFAVKPETK